MERALGFKSGALLLKEVSYRGRAFPSGRIRSQKQLLIDVPQENQEKKKLTAVERL